MILGVDGPGFKLQLCPISGIMNRARPLTPPWVHLSVLDIEIKYQPSRGGVKNSEMMDTKYLA